MTTPEQAGPLQTVFTVGHSTHPIEEFIALLHAHRIEQIVDVRTIARSRHNPQYNEDELSASLELAKIAYQRMKSLGGLRHGIADSPNQGWNNASFRAFADYMQTPDFAHAFSDLIAVTAVRRTAIMCAEVLPWRCHRRLIADALLIHDIPAWDILNKTTTRTHQLTDFARVEGFTLTYPAG
jgi:uncharacterized protein (DUF488 family)